MDLLAVRRVKSRLNNAFDAIGCLRIVRRARPDPPMAGTRAMWKPSNNATNLSGGVPTLDEDRVRFTSAPTGAVGHPRVFRFSVSSAAQTRPYAPLPTTDLIAYRASTSNASPPITYCWNWNGWPSRDVDGASPSGAPAVHARFGGTGEWRAGVTYRLAGTRREAIEHLENSSEVHSARRLQPP